MKPEIAVRRLAVRLLYSPDKWAAKPFVFSSCSRLRTAPHGDVRAKHCVSGRGDLGGKNRWLPARYSSTQKSTVQGPKSMRLGAKSGKVVMT
jgi:hypothetical protein